MNDVILVIFSAAIGYLCSKVSESATRRREFRAYLNVLMVEIDSLSPYNALEKYKTTTNEVRIKCAAVEDDVFLWKRDCFRAAWQRYSSDHARYEAGVARGKTLFLFDKEAGSDARAEILRRLSELRGLAG